MENVVLVVVVPLVGERGKEEGGVGGGGSEYSKTSKIFNQLALIKIWDFAVLPRFQQFYFPWQLLTPNLTISDLDFSVTLATRDQYDEHIYK